VVCLVPLAGYLLTLNVIVRRHHPTVVKGTWDFAGLLVGLSGFILFGGMVLLSLVQSNFRFWTRGNFEALRAAWGQEQTSWGLVAVGYFVLVVGGCYLTLASRRRMLVVYNIDPDRFETALTESFEHLGRPIERRGHQWISGYPLCELEPFPGGKTVTLRWLAQDHNLFVDVERHLRDAVRLMASRDNPAARWLSAAAAGCLIVVGFCLAFFVGVAVYR
jgi:hypothetical protein